MVSNHSTYKAIDESLKNMISSLANNNPAPQEVVIKRTSFDGIRWFADVDYRGGYIRAVPCNGYPKVGSIATMFFLGGSYDYPMLLCNMLDLFDVYTPFQSVNILDNGNFEVYDDEEGFYGWNGDVEVGTDGLYGEQSLLLKPNCTVLSNPIDITQLPLNEDDLTVIQVYYNWLGQAFNLRIKDLTNGGYVTFAPEGLNITTEELETSSEWCYHRTVFLKRDYEMIQLEFYNPSDSPVLIDGVRVWVQDFEEWSPSLKDYDGIGDEMDYENEIDKNNVGLKETLKKIFKDVNKRLQQIDGETGGDTPTTQKTETFLALEADDISINENVYIAGFLTDMEDNPISGATINLSITYENEETTTTTVTTDSDGTFDTENKNISPLCTGTAEVTATYNGNNEYEASEETTSFNINCKFEYNDADYTVNLLECGVLKNGDNIAGTGVRFTLTDDENTIFSAETLGFSTRTGAAQFKDSDNNTITYKLYYNNELQSDAQPLRPFNNQYEEMKIIAFSSYTVQETDTFKLEVIIADENNTTLTELAIECNNPNIVESE